VAVIRLDRGAIGRGALVAALIAVPAALVGAWASDRDDLGWLGGLAVVVVLIGLVVGGAVAANRQRLGAPLTHGILAAGLLFVVVQAFGIIRRLIADDQIVWSRVLSSAVLALVAGAIGGVIGGRLDIRARREAA
jgi:putative membrane protein (TIGR04086 family)